MKKFALSIALLAVMAAVAQAQVRVDYSRENRNSRLRITVSSGYSGYGGYYGYGYGSYFGGSCYPGYGSLYMAGPSVFAYGNGGYGYYSGPYYGESGYGARSYFGGYGVYRAGYGRPSASTDAAGPVSRTGPVADRIQEFASAREIEEGRRRLKLGDYKGAVNQFRSAVTSYTESPLAQAWFAVSLAIAGDGKNADKALRAAAAGGLSAEKLGLEDAFHDEKERGRVIAALSRVSGDGSLAAAFALSLAGDPAKLKQLAEKDAVARRLLPAKP